MTITVVRTYLAYRGSEGPSIILNMSYHPISPLPDAF
jgi:hypothetical protein